MGSAHGRVGVVGGGLGGLAAACTLAARGHEVVLFERNSWLGGKAAVLERDGFRFDMGPTILTLPGVLKRIFAESDTRLADALELVRLDPQWRCFFEGGGRLDLREDTEAMAAGLEEWAAGMGEGYRCFMEASAELHRISDDYFFWRPIGGLSDMTDGTRTLSLNGLKLALKMHPARTVAGLVRKHLPEKCIAQLADHFTQYVGSSPFKAPAILCSIAHMQTEQGLWYPMGGTGAVPRALAELAADLGVEVRLRTAVQRVLLRRGLAVGVETADGAKLELAAVVSNCDSVRTFAELLGGEPARRFRKRRRYEPACSGVVLYLGLSERYPHLSHHNFVFSRDAREEFNAIYNRGEPAPDPTCYVCAPAQTDATVAPKGGEALYVLVHTPHLGGGQDWEALYPQYRSTIVAKLARTGAMPDLEDRIVCEDFLTPRDIDARYHVLRGAIYGLASHGRLTGAFKPNNRSPDIAGLYLAGGSAHPGAGMPMVMMSGWIAGDAVDRDLGGQDGRSTLESEGGADG